MSEGSHSPLAFGKDLLVAAKARTSPRKTPIQARSQQTVDAIVDAMARVLVTEGYDRASTNRVAQVAGVSIGSLYQYFPSKEALVSALVERHNQKMIAVSAGSAAALFEAPLEVFTREIVRALLEAQAVDPKLHKVLIEQVPRVGRLARVNEMEKRVETQIRAKLERHAAEIRPKDTALAAFLLVRAVKAVTWAAVAERSQRLDDPELAREITAMALGYLGVTPTA